MSNGSDRIYFRRPRNFALTRTITVTNAGEPVENLNELEWVAGSIFANVWQSDLVMRIDPKSGEVTGIVDLTPLHDAEEASGDPDVTNGIAYLHSAGHLYVTGKMWSNVYELELHD